MSLDVSSEVGANGSNAAVKRTIGKDTAAQPSATAEPRLRAGTDRLVHPVARSALFHAFELYALEFERGADQIVQR